MKVILLQDVKSLGKEGDIVNVSDGYARNFVIPKKLGVEANDKNKNDLKLKKQREAKEAAAKLADAQKLAQEAVDTAVGALAVFGAEADFLRELVAYLVKRNK